MSSLFDSSRRHYKKMAFCFPRRQGRKAFQTWGRLGRARSGLDTTWDTLRTPVRCRTFNPAATALRGHASILSNQCGHTSFAGTATQSLRRDKKTVLVALRWLVCLSAPLLPWIRDSNLLASQTGDRKRISSSKLNALQALGVGLDNRASAKVAVDAKAETTAVDDHIHRLYYILPLSLCLGDGTKMLAADAHGKTLVGWWQFDDIAGYDSSGHGGYAKPVHN